MGIIQIWRQHISLNHESKHACSNTGNLTNIIDKKIHFPQGSLTDFRVEGNYCYGFVKENYEEVIEQFLAINSTRFVTKEAHFKQKGHRRFSETGKFNLNLFSYE